MRESRVRFIRQLGYVTHRADDELYSALMLQPRTVGAILALGIVVQKPSVFLILSALLLWSALVPALNPFDAIYNYGVARPRGRRPVDAAPAPRRAAAGMAGTVALTIAIALVTGATVTAWVVEGLLAFAVMQVIFRDSCAGAIVFCRLRRRLSARPSDSGAIDRCVTI